MHHKLLQKYLNSSIMAKLSVLVVILLVMSQTVLAQDNAPYSFSFGDFGVATNEDETPDKAEYSFLFGSFRPAKHKTETPFGAKGLCIVGCTPYVDPADPTAGILKYRELVREMAKDCDVLVHIGDTKPGKMACNRTVMTNAVHILEEAGRLENKLVLYAPGDNELNDCHRHNSSDTKVPSDIYKAADARKFLADDLRLESLTDLTGRYALDNHDMSDKTVPGTNQSYSCDFDKYVELDNYAIATLEVMGSNMYLGDERLDGYPYQDEVDPLKGRLSMYLNANDCALEWIEQSAEKASASGKRALFFLFHASFYTSGGFQPRTSDGIGEFYSRDNLKNYTRELTGVEIERPFQPLFDKLTETALNYPDLMFYAVHSDAHRYSTVRMNPAMNNSGKKRFSNHNMMLHQVEGSSRALTMFSKFMVDSASFQPVTVKQEWSEAAFNQEPVGHSWKPY
jgi:hypothetical protein